MKKDTTASFQAYGPQQLYDFLKQDMVNSGCNSISQEIVHALTEYARTKGYNPEQLHFDNSDQIVEAVINDSQLAQKILTQLLRGFDKNGTKCLCLA